MHRHIMAALCRHQREPCRRLTIRGEDGHFAEDDFQSPVFAQQPLNIGHARAAECAGIIGKDRQRHITIRCTRPSARKWPLNLRPQPVDVRRGLTRLQPVHRLRQHLWMFEEIGAHRCAIAAIPQ